MQYATPIICAIIAAIAAISASVTPYLANRKQDKRKDNDGLKQAVRFLLYDKIEHLCLTYIDRGSVTATQRKLLINAWEVYHTKLGGNGYLDDLMSLMKNLPIKE